MICFVNINFFAAEISIIKNKQNAAQLEKIVKLLSGSLLEEEDSCETSDTNSNVKEIDILEGQFHRLQFQYKSLADTQRDLRKDDITLNSGYCLILTPPPDASIL
jgi:hypothetical protein